MSIRQKPAFYLQAQIDNKECYVAYFRCVRLI